MFTSVISCLSWTEISGRHWTAPAFWYASIGLALTSVILAAQQMLVIDTLRIPNAVAIRQRLVYRTKSGRDRPKRIMLLVWQAPTQSLSYSMTCFLAGLMSYIYSPVARKMAWDDDAKVGPCLVNKRTRSNGPTDCCAIRCNDTLPGFQLCGVLFLGALHRGLTNEAWSRGVKIRHINSERRNIVIRDEGLWVRQVTRANGSKMLWILSRKRNGARRPWQSREPCNLAETPTV